MHVCKYQPANNYDLSQTSLCVPICVTSQALSTALDVSNTTLARACVTGIGREGSLQHSVIHTVPQVLSAQTQGSTGGFRDMGVSYGRVSQVSPLSIISHHHQCLVPSSIVEVP